MHLTPSTVLWIYIIFLLVGGLIGFLKAGSKISLITSSAAAAVLIICTTEIFAPRVAVAIINIVMALLIVVFAIRLSKTRKFMPSGMLLVVTIIALALRHFVKG